MNFKYTSSCDFLNLNLKLFMGDIVDQSVVIIFNKLSGIQMVL